MSLLSWVRARLAAVFSPSVSAPSGALPAAVTPQPASDRAAEARVSAAEARADEAIARAKRAEDALAAAGGRKGKGKARSGEAKPAKADADAASDADAKAARAETREAQSRERKAAARAEELEARERKAGERIKDLEQKLENSRAKTRETESLLKAAEAMVRASPAPAAPAAAGSRGGVAEAYFSPGESCLQAIRAQFARAKSTVEVCVFTVTDDRIAGFILDAHRRGVKVRLISDNDKSMDEGSDVERIARAGVPVRRDMSEYHMHHKFAVFDRRVLLTGSYNWTRGAANFNEENIVLTDEPRLLAAFSEEFETLWAKFGAQ